MLSRHRDCQIVRSHYVDGKSVRDVGLSLSVSKSTVHRTIQEFDRVMRIMGIPPKQTPPDQMRDIASRLIARAEQELRLNA